MAKLDQRTIEMIKAIYAARKTYIFFDTSVSPDDDYYECAVSARNLEDAWEYLDNDRDRYVFIDEINY